MKKNIKNIIQAIVYIIAILIAVVSLINHYVLDYMFFNTKQENSALILAILLVIAAKIFNIFEKYK